MIKSIFLRLCSFFFELVDITCDVKIGSADVTIAVDGAIKKVRQNQNRPPP